MKVFEWHSELAERLRLKLGWSHYAIYWVSFIKGCHCTFAQPQLFVNLYAINSITL